MKEVLFCAYDPMLIKNLYGILRQDGYNVEVADHLSAAVRMVMGKQYGAVVMDTWPFGIATEDAVQAMKSVCPGLSILVLGKVSGAAQAVSVEGPADTEALRKIIHAINGIEDMRTENKTNNERAS